MQVFLALLVLVLIPFTTLTKAERISKKGCNDTCGGVSIPFPFGIGINCSLNEWFNVECNSSTPYLSALNNMEVLRLQALSSYDYVTVNFSITFDCQNQVKNSTLVLSEGSPYYFSTNNKLFVEGCGIYADVSSPRNDLVGCSTICPNNTVSDSDRKNCIGIGCCQATMSDSYLKWLSVNVRGLESPDGDGSCGSGSAFLMDSKYFKGAGFPRPSLDGVNIYVPIKLWLDSGSYESDNSSRECKWCLSKGGYCDLNLDSASGMSCYIYRKNIFRVILDKLHIPSHVSAKLGVILGVSISAGLLFLMVASYALYKIIKKTKAKRRKQRFFKRNGGLVLKQQQETDAGLVDKTILFTSKELEKATDHFNENRILGRGGQGTVYKGMLPDGRIVAVKKSKVVDESQLEDFINEVVILSQINHRNVVKLLGCCLETEVPLLVSEFIINGTLYDLIQNETGEFSISFYMSLQIATEVAGALSYLHSATSIPIYHRDIKTTNILLDEKYRAKVSDFGTSRFVAIDQTHLTTLVKGTFGYLDPEYFQSSQFTEKSDVYSFGVVLLELLTREKPISLTRFGENRSLATHFILAMEEGRVMSIFDARVAKEGARTELLAIANLAMRCLNFSGKNRPTMKEVAVVLESIRLSHVPSEDQTNCGRAKQCEEMPLTYGESTSTTMSITFGDNHSQ